jgi:hypothetical protein
MRWPVTSFACRLQYRLDFVGVSPHIRRLLRWPLRSGVSQGLWPYSDRPGIFFWEGFFLSSSCPFLRSEAWHSLGWVALR